MRLITYPLETSEFALNFFENHLLSKALNLIELLPLDNKFVDRGFLASDLAAEAYPLPSLIYNLTKCLLQDGRPTVFTYRPLLYSKILTFLVAYGVVRVRTVLSCKLYSAYKYFELASYMMTNLRCKVEE